VSLGDTGANLPLDAYLVGFQLPQV
jgi:hypothetical protein